MRVRRVDFLEGEGRRGKYEVFFPNYVRLYTKKFNL